MVGRRHRRRGHIAAMPTSAWQRSRFRDGSSWDPTLVAASIVLGGFLGCGSAPAAGLQATGGDEGPSGALLLTLAICQSHFTAMSRLDHPRIRLLKFSIPRYRRAARDCRGIGELHDLSFCVWPAPAIEVPIDAAASSITTACGAWQRRGRRAS